MTPISYDQVLAEITKKRPHLLLGNGFSIGCDPVFDYESLYQEALKSGLSPRVQVLFKKLGTNNFEGVMRLLNDADWVAREYDLITDDSSELLEDKEAVKNALIAAVATTHPEDAGHIPEERRASAWNFLQPYHNVFTTNYDFLLYWIIMHTSNPAFEDGFRTDPDDPYSLIFSERIGGKRGIFYLHGALHLFHVGGDLRKHSWVKTGIKLTTWVCDGIRKDQYPLFVAEGHHEKKLEQIQNSPYLWYCLDKLTSIQTVLVIFGHSLSENDGHVVSRIVGNHKLKKIYVGLRDARSKSGLTIQSIGAQMQSERDAQKDAPPLEIVYFDSTSAHVWDTPMETVIMPKKRAAPPVAENSVL